MRSASNYWQGISRAIIITDDLFDLLASFVAWHVWHLQVHEYNIVKSISFFSEDFPYFLNSLPAGGSTLQIWYGVQREDFLQYDEVKRWIIDD